MTPLPTTLHTGRTTVGLRRATADDVPALVALLTDDPLGRDRETPDLAPYERAFAAVDADPAQLLLAVTDGPDVVGTVQLTEIPGLSRGGTTRLQVEAVRVRSDLRGGGKELAWLRRGPPARLRSRAADHRHPPSRGPPLLRAAGVHRLARRLQAPAVSHRARSATTWA